MLFLPSSSESSVSAWGCPFLILLVVSCILCRLERCDGFGVHELLTPHHQYQHRIHGRRTRTIPYSKSSLVATSPKPYIPTESNENDSNIVTTMKSNNSINRRTVFQKSTAVISAALISTISSISSTLPSNAEETSESISSTSKLNNKPVVIIGGGGKVGTICTRLLAEDEKYCRSVTRSGRSVLEDTQNPFVTYAAADVNSYESLREVCKGASAVIFTASASGKKKGGDPAHVDYKGVYNTAKACLDENVSQLIIVSASTVTRPDSIGFKATNAFVKFVYGDRIMDYKMAGENVVRSLYAAAKSDQPNVSYTIVRPGGLNENPSVGSEKLHISQGDVYVSEVTREDVARVCLACLGTRSAYDATFELNQIEGIAKAQKNLPDLPAELIRNGAQSYVALLDQLKSDTIMSQQYSSILSTFGGNGIEPIDQIV